MTHRRFDCVFRTNNGQYELETIRTSPPNFQTTEEEARLNDNGQPEYFELDLADDFENNIPSPATIAAAIEGGPLTGARRPQPRIEPDTNPIVEAAPALTIDQLMAFGRSLYLQVFDRGIATAIRNWRNQPGPDGVIRIDDSRALITGGLEGVPWEALCAPQGTPFAIDPSLTVTRLISDNHQPQPLQPLPSDTTLRIFVAIAEPGDGGPLLGQEELNDIFNAVEDSNGTRNIQVTPEHNITATELNTQLGHPNAHPDHHHIVHMICHAEFDGTRGYAILTDNQNQGQIVQSEFFANLFAASPPHVVVLNSCRSAQADINNPASGLATALINAGVPYVVAMQYRITNDAAKIFSKAFYKAIKDGREVPAAVAMGRRAIYGQGQGNATEFITPVLYTSKSPPGLFALPVVPPEDPPPPRSTFGERLDAFYTSNRFKVVAGFAGGAVIILAASIGVTPIFGYFLTIVFLLVGGYTLSRLLGYGGRPATGPDGAQRTSHKREVIILSSVLIMITVLFGSLWLFQGPDDMQSSPQNTPGIPPSQAPVAQALPTPSTGSISGATPTPTIPDPIPGTEPELVPSPAPVATIVLAPVPARVAATVPSPLVPAISTTLPAPDVIAAPVPSLPPVITAVPDPSPAPVIITVPEPSSAPVLTSNQKSVFAREDFLPSNSPNNVCWDGNSRPSLQVPYSEGSTICSQTLDQTSGSIEFYVHICTKTGSSYGWKRSPVTKCYK